VTHDASDPQPLEGSPWSCLETVPGPSAVWTVWKESLGANYESFKSAFLQGTSDRPVKFFPCLWRCGCSHEVIRRDDGRLFAECRCKPRRCDGFGLSREDIIPWEVNWSKLGRGLCTALGLTPKTARLGLYNTQQIGCWSADAVPVILTIQAHDREFLHTVSALVGRIGKPFILVAPTGQHLGSSARELLETAGAVFLPLDAYTIFKEDGALEPTKGVRELLDQVAPNLREPEAEDDARRAAGLIERMESECPMNAPTVSTVMRLYCVEELTITQIARRCRCSVGTVAGRLKLVRKKTGMNPKDLRRVSDHLSQIQADVAAAKAEYTGRRRREGGS